MDSDIAWRWFNACEKWWNKYLPPDAQLRAIQTLHDIHNRKEYR